MGQDMIIKTASVKDGTREFLKADHPVIIEARGMIDALSDSKVKKALLGELEALLARAPPAGISEDRQAYSAIQLIRDLKAAHAGGQGIYLPRILNAGNTVNIRESAYLLIHELTAGVLASGMGRCG
jgi:hypothetical protein